MGEIKINIRDKYVTLDELRKEDEYENSTYQEFMECIYQHIEQQHQEIERLKREIDLHMNYLYETRDK